jgi:hypothetical protein
MPVSIWANPELLERPGQVRTEQVRTEPAGDADECGREEPAPSRRLGLLIAVSTAVVFYGAIAACIWHFL